jgi:hypothetical protein
MNRLKLKQNALNADQALLDFNRYVDLMRPYLPNFDQALGMTALVVNILQSYTV